MSINDTYIVSLDVGSSSVRALLFDGRGNQQAGFGEQLAYEMTKTPDGGVEADADSLARITIQCLATLHGQIMRNATTMRPLAVAASAFWHSFLGVDGEGKPTTPILHLFDTRSSKEADELARKLDANAVHQRTGCPIHTSYWPAKLLWLERARPQAFRATRRWMSFPEYLFLKLFGEPALSVSMVSGSGLWNQALNDYDNEVLAALPIQRDQLWPVDRMDEAQTRLLDSYRSELPLFDGIPWFPADGDGACGNLGSGCVSAGDFCLMVGTSGAMRAVTGATQVEVGGGLWCYRVDRRRYILGGALTNGGDVYAWMLRNLVLPDRAEDEIARRRTGQHGLTLLPYFGGERSPYWRPDLRGSIGGLNLATMPIDILQAALESVALSFRAIYERMRDSLGAPERVIASGGALLRSPVWTQMMADALGVPVHLGKEPEASARGAALLALERLGAELKEVPEAREAFEPRAESVAVFDRLHAQRQIFYQKLYGEN